jgi:hypothetical protein
LSCSTNGEKRNACRLLLGKDEGKRPLRRPRRRWANGIKMYFGEIGWAGMQWMYLVLGNDQWTVLVKTVMNLRIA